MAKRRRGTIRRGRFDFLLRRGDLPCAGSRLSILIGSCRTRRRRNFKCHKSIASDARSIWRTAVCSGLFRALAVGKSVIAGRRDSAPAAGTKIRQRHWDDAKIPEFRATFGGSLRRLLSGRFADEVFNLASLPAARAYGLIRRRDDGRQQGAGDPGRRKMISC